MTKTYNNRKKMVRENFISFDGTSLSRDEIVNRIKTQGFDDFYFETVATSSGLYGINGAVIDIETNTDIPETIATFSILSRNTTLLEFI